MTPAKNGGQPNRTFREFQFIVLPVILVEEDGGIPFPVKGEETICRGLAELQTFVDEFPANLEMMNTKADA